VQLIADRFAVDSCGRAIDLATGERVCFLMSALGSSAEQAAWAERCAWLSMVVHPALAPLIDYGMVGEAQRFEAWAAEPGWTGSGRIAQRACESASRFLEANGRTAGARVVEHIGTRDGCVLIVPDVTAAVRCGPVLPDAEHSHLECDAIGVLREPDRRVAAVAELCSGGLSARVTAVGIWTTDEREAAAAVRALARAARLSGCVPMSTCLWNSTIGELARGRTHVLIARNDIKGGWTSVLGAALESPKPHMVLFVGPTAVQRVHTVIPEQCSPSALMASICPPGASTRHSRQVHMAARRSRGVRGRFEQLLFGSPVRSTPPAPEAQRTVAQYRFARPERPRRGERAAEQSVTYVTDARTSAVSPGGPAERSWPAMGELARLRRQMESVRVLMASGRYHPAERSARQAMHAFARREEWTAATDGALLLARSLARRGRLVEAGAVVRAARSWAMRSTSVGGVQDVALVQARLQTECGLLAEAESLLETTLASAMSTGYDTVGVSLALARCLYWQGRYADAWHRLTLAAPDAEAMPASSVSLWIARSRVLIGRGRVADAVADAARARDAAIASNIVDLRGSAYYACALAQLAAGDRRQASEAASRALQDARQTHDPLLAICARVLRAEIARRQGERRDASLLVKRFARLSRSRMPATVQGRIDLLADLLAAADPVEAGERRADSSGLAALRLFAPQRAPTAWATAPAADEIVELLRCCQVAEEDRAVLTAVCGRLRGRLRAAGVAFFADDTGQLVSVASEGTRVDPASARRVLTANQLVLPHEGGERIEAGVPVRFAGQTVGVLAAQWTAASVWHVADVAILLSTGATAAGPAVAGVIARRVSERAARSSELLGVSTAMAAVRSAVERAANAPFAALIEGESGTGKELVARLLHKLGARRDRPFSTLNCAALPDDLVESELFGHARGAFTGAVADRRGVFEEANTGTLFLDEVGELSPRAQAKLLRAIQEGEIRRVGENVCRRVDVRLLTATNRDLRVEAAAGRFRLDLLYRMDVIRIVLPSLRDRRDDIPVLAEHFWREAAGRVGSRAMLSAATLASLARYDWPGNIRELQNVLASLAVRCPRRGVIPPTALPAAFGERQATGAFRLEAARRTFDRAFIHAALVRVGGQRSRAAEELGVSRQGLAKLMARLDLTDAGTSGGSSHLTAQGEVSG
jgi:DNA-binding NtrC family response regulator/tetratricopeptide (TPR) repeat protein